MKDLKLGTIGIKVFNMYCNTLGISSELGKEIFNINSSMREYIEAEHGLRTQNLDYTLSILLRGTLLRQLKDFQKITPAEIKLLRERYNIKIEEL